MEEKKVLLEISTEAQTPSNYPMYPGPLWPFSLGVPRCVVNNQLSCFPPECSELGSKYSHFASQSTGHAVISKAHLAPSASHPKFEMPVHRKCYCPSDKPSKSSAFPVGVGVWPRNSSSRLRPAPGRPNEQWLACYSVETREAELPALVIKFWYLLLYGNHSFLCLRLSFGFINS